MKRLLLILSIFSLFSFKLQSDSELIVQRWYKVDGDKKILIRELFYTNLSQGELIKAVYHVPKDRFKRTVRYSDGLVTHLEAFSNSMQLNNEYYHYDNFRNLIKIVDSSRNSVFVTNFDIKEYSKDNKVLRAIDNSNDQEIVYKHEYPKNGHIRRTFLNESLIGYKADYFYENGNLMAKVNYFPNQLYDSVYHTFNNGIKTLEERYRMDSLIYSMKFKYENDTLKKIDKHYPDGTREEIIVEHD